MFCQYCGLQISQKMAVCPRCGAPLAPNKKGNDNKNSNNLIIIVSLLAALLVVCMLVYMFVFKGSDRPAASDAGGEVKVIDTRSGTMVPLSTPQTMNVIASSLNVRKYPDKNSMSIAKIGFGSAVQIIGYDGAWSYVRVTSPSSYAGTEGYVATSYLLSPSDYGLLKSLYSNEMISKAKYQSSLLIPLLDYCKKQYSDSAIREWSVYDIRYQGNIVEYYIYNRFSNVRMVVQYTGVNSSHGDFHVARLN